jgi:hypothetical protein
MNKVVGVVGAISGLAALDSAQAAVVTPDTGLPQAQSYAELLDPIPNAVAVLRAVEAADAVTAQAEPADEASVTLVGYHHHHHRVRDHHHHRVIIRHHHHHHHRVFRHHHHHHHHRSGY